MRPHLEALATPPAVRTPGEIGRMRQVARALFSVFQEITLADLEGAPAIRIDRTVRRALSRRGLTSEMAGYRGYPAHCAISPNAVAVHGVPDRRPIARGDVVTVDIAARGGGWVSDAAWTYLLPGSSRRVADEYRRAWQGFAALARIVSAGMTVADLASAAASIAASHELATIPEFVGHGIGRQLHESPIVPFAKTTLQPPNDAVRGHDADAVNSGGPATQILPSGCVINIEPVFTGGDAAVCALPDGWGWITNDGRPTYHFELSLLVTPEGAQVLQLDGLAAAELPDEPPFGWAR